MNIFYFLHVKKLKELHVIVTIYRIWVDDILTQYKPNDYSPDNYFLYIRCPHCDRNILIKCNDKSRLQYWYIKNKIK